MSSSFAASSDDASTRESSASSQSMPVAKSSSGICSASPNSTEDQHPIKDKNIGGRPNNTQTSRFISEFEPMDCLGSGGFGSVYKARHKLTAKVYAVKIVSWEEKSLREVKTLSDLQHPNIVRYYTVWMDTSGYRFNSSQSASERYLYIQMELCGTKTLRGWIKEMNDQNPQDPHRREKSLSIAQAITNGVEYIHSEKHFHRDLKPENILFGRDGTVKIGDFGLVTRDDDEFDLMDRTVGKGTPTYMAPEQKKEKKYGRKVDIFSMGLIFLELLWKVSSWHERGNLFRDARCQMFPKDFSLTFPQEREIIKPMLCEKPEGRPEASELKKDLDKWAQIFNTQSQPNESVTV
uniref:eukaryotic translation initiation factor 2-alpha kinase-like n=1 Tax=Scatophagus argus TaxID=75038 RepID=UPI001ED7E005|nr:eukaryotic translation initiation factor 2-alpha kinase-like [Scatophagus argus]